jgi:hypothetical protein
VNADLSVAPEIAQLATSPRHVPSLAGRLLGPPATTGRLASGLSRLAAAPQRWWDLVRFNPDGPARIAVPAPFDAWLLVIPPGYAADCHCELATLVAGEAAEGPLSVERAIAKAGSAPLRQGRVRVNGLGSRDGHTVSSTGHGYSVSLHAGGPATARFAQKGRSG